MAQRDIREGDTLTLRVRVVRVSGDGERVTVSVLGQQVTAGACQFDFLKHEKGENWPS